MNKTVYAFNTETMAFEGAVELNESDLSPREEGVWLIPGNCLETAPPFIPAGKYAAAEDGSWVLRDIPEPELPVDPEPEAPEPIRSITMRQARLALLREGILNNVDTAIAALPSPQREAAQIEWNYGSIVDRSSPLVSLLSVALNLTPAALDNLFEKASRL
ncbi:hypothetical protein [Variovorax sp. PMC12]|uniref:hypothetical protein n=1 Tax=Variovorax sp. PMC12 TaxID=2126319 RepID=UPI000D1224B1|nr:hypothetical protein [Variovorax sp. PMC12]AVQ80763.1 hypothetical protein C4F17_07250 [Variovorax sp. PMC12]